MIHKVLENLKISALNEMQLAALEATKEEKDLLLLSPTGSGKTLGFLLPVLNKLNTEEPGIQALVLVPSRELAIQIEQVFKSMGTGHKVNCCYGGHSTRTEKNNLEHPPALLVGTPGRIAYHLVRKNIDPSSIHTIILDEFDKALEFGFKPDMSYIISQLKNLKRRYLTSATDMPEIPDFTGVKSPAVLNFLKVSTPPALKLKAVKAVGKDKIMALFSLICKLGNKPTLVFCNHRDAVERISELLRNKDLGHDIFHGGMEQEDREKALIKFRNGTHHLLITTDLASRGLDIPEIENIVHYQLATTENTFIHRNGRTARMKAEGTAYLVLAEDEEIPDYIKTKPEFVSLPEKNILPEKSPWATLYIGAGRKDKINKMDIVGFLIQTGKLQKEEVGLIEVLDYASYVAVKREKTHKVLMAVRNEKIKKKSVKIELAK
ncbi:MAG: DEAD/DEAH box helicase [Bacteroidetes bacterium]|nr:DEAD/DEAH box helicase [Bacteroidota bacterium]